MIAVFVASLAFSIALCVHAVRSGQATFWLWIILMFQPLGGVVYVAAVILPDLLGGRTARKLSKAAQTRLDPERDYRTAKQAVDDAPTVRNRMRLAEAAAALGRWDEAEACWREAATGVHADDPTLLLGRSRALMELNRPAEALPILEGLGELGEAGRTPQAALLLGRANHALGRWGEADRAYQWAAMRMPGLEAMARYTAFMAEAGRRDEAQEALDEIDKRVAKSTAEFRTEARAWRDYAAAALAR